MRSRLASGRASPEEFRRAYLAVPSAERDAWLDRLLGIDELPDDRELPSGCVPYVPCPADTLLRAVEHAEVDSGDVFVDIGSGCGRALALTHLLTGAGAIGIEIQPELVQRSREVAAGLNATRLAVVEGDAVRLSGYIAIGSVFFLYCPFGGHRLERVLDDLEWIARTREIRICCVHLPLPYRPWLRELARPSEELTVYRSTLARAL